MARRNGKYGMPTHDVRTEGIHSVSGFYKEAKNRKETKNVTLEVNPLSGNAFLTTADKHSKEAVNNMIEERRKQFNTAIKNGKIAPQWRLKQNAVSLGSQSSVDITLSELIKKVKMLRKTFNQTVWYGSAYTFDAFDISKIGFGEGHQVHGWGVYFVKEEEVAKSYKNYVRNLVNKPAKISITGLHGGRNRRKLFQGEYNSKENKRRNVYGY